MHLVQGVGSYLDRVEAEQQQPLGWQQRVARAEAGQGWRSVAEQMRHPHRVQDAGLGRGRGAQVDVAVEVQHTKPRVVPQQPGNHPQGDRAVPAKHQRDPPCGHGARHPVGDPPGHGHHLVEVLLGSVGPARPVQSQRQITVVDHIQPGVQEPVDQARTAQPQRRLLQPDPVGAGAGQHTDEREPDQLASLLTHPSPDRSLILQP
jgi:hypothetical protein